MHVIHRFATVAALAMLLLAGVAGAQTPAFPPAGWVDISVPILGNGTAPYRETSPTTGPWRPDVPAVVQWKYNNAIPSIMVAVDPRYGHPAVQYARVTVKIEDVEKVTSRIPEDQVPQSDLMIVSLCRSRNIRSSQAFQAATDTKLIQHWFDDHSERWTTPEGKSDGRKVLVYVRDIGATKFYCDFLAKRYGLNEEPPPVVAETPKTDQP